MAKRATMTAEHLETKKASKPATTPANLPEGASKKAPVKDNRKGMSLRLPVLAWKQLKRLAVDEGKPAHDVVLEGLDLVFAKYGLSPVNWKEPKA